MFIYSADVCKSVSPIMLCEHTVYQKQAQVPSVQTLFWFPNFLGLPTNGSKPDHIIHLVILSWLIIVNDDGGGESGDGVGKALNICMCFLINSFWAYKKFFCLKMRQDFPYTYWMLP